MKKEVLRSTSFILQTITDDHEPSYEHHAIVYW